MILMDCVSVIGEMALFLIHFLLGGDIMGRKRIGESEKKLVLR